MRAPYRWRAILCCSLFFLAGCAGRPTSQLIPVAATAPDASEVDMLVATTRADSPAPAEMFNGERGVGLAFADIAVSIPPDKARVIGEIQWPSSVPGDPAHSFVTLRADRLSQTEAIERFNARIKDTPHRHVLLFVHGYNTRFQEAVYRFAQIVHDAGAPVLPVLFTWPSGGKMFDYAYDRESAAYSRDGLEAVLQAMDKDPKVAEISILAHSMGNFVAIEALRQMAIRNRAISPKIRDIMLASPDVDVDVFRRQIAEIERSDKDPPVVLFVSRDDRALALSRQIAGDVPRLGAIDPAAEPYRSMLERARVDVIDLTKVSSQDAFNHGKFAESDVVKTIGMRLASGQTLTDAKLSLSERIGGVAKGAAIAVADAATVAVSGSVAAFDSDSRQTLEQQAAEFQFTADGHDRGDGGGYKSGRFRGD